ncbi:MAG TPA: hypothetical protein VN860_06505, partial [Candidatus Acidoferrales bacterium]|nr:hypothetical protein [Candidatus Acidoferrales bacterium]
LRMIALFGAIIVAVGALLGLRSEWKKNELEDHVTKIMMVLLTIGCVFVILVALRVWGQS